MGRAYRVLVVEDEACIALDIASDLAAQGMTIVGPAKSVGEALELIQRDQIDAAILDVKLGDADSGQVADILQLTGVPFLFLSGYSTEKLPTRHRQQPFMAKPYKAGLLFKAIKALARLH